MYKLEFSLGKNSSESFPGTLVLDSEVKVLESDRKIFRQSLVRVQEYFENIGVKAHEPDPNISKDLKATETGRGSIVNVRGESILNMSFNGIFDEVQRKLGFNTRLRESSKEFAHIARHELIHWFAPSTARRIVACGRERAMIKSGFSSLQVATSAAAGSTRVKDYTIGYMEGIVEKAALESGDDGEAFVHYAENIQLIESILDVVARGDKKKREEFWRKMLQDYLDGTSKHFLELQKAYDDPQAPRIFARFNNDDEVLMRRILEYADPKTTKERRAEIKRS